MTRLEFVRWIVSEVEKSIRGSSGKVYRYVPPSEYRIATERLLRPLSASIVMPSPYPWRGLNNYAEQVWERNLVFLDPVYYSQGKVYNSYKSATTSSHSSTTISTISQNRNKFSTQPSLSTSTYNSRSANNLKKNKDGVKAEYNALISLFEDIITKFRGLILSNPELSIIHTQLISKLSYYLDAINQEKKYALNNMSWDKLVIGFFGETNAGKSTIIESLRILLNEQTRKTLRQRKGNCDGEIVGDGRQDFTQDYHEYDMCINGQNFMLIDVPGIEGKENLYKGKIGEALRKAHLIFYVNGHNKNIDKGTAGKIKEYMGDGVKVVVLQNIRGNVGQYEYSEDRKSLMTSNTRTIIEGVKRDFKMLLGEKFHTAIPVMGLLAMCAYGEFSPIRENLTKKQRMLIDLFSEDCDNNPRIARNKIRQFSNIDEVINLINVRSNNFKTEIANANFAKMEMFCHRALNEYVDEVDEKKAKFESYRKQVDRFIRENSEEIQTTVQQFERTVHNKVKDKITTLSEKAFDYISKCQWESLDSCFKNSKKEIEYVIHSNINSYSKSLTDRINERANLLKAIPGFTSNGITLKIYFQIDDIYGINEIKGKDDITFGDVMTSVTSTATGATTGAIVGGAIGTVIPVVGTAIGAWIGGFLGGAVGNVKGNIDAGEAQTIRAQTKAKEIISAYRTKTEDNIKLVSKKFRDSVNREVRTINQTAKVRIQEVDKFYDVTRTAEQRLKDKLQSIHKYGK